MKERSVFLRVCLVLIMLFSYVPAHAMQPTSWNPWNYLRNISPIITRSFSENRPTLTGALVTGAGIALTTAAIGFLGYSWYTMRTQLARITGERAEWEANLQQAREQAEAQRRAAEEAAQRQAQEIEQAQQALRQAEAQRAVEEAQRRAAQEEAQRHALAIEQAQLALRQAEAQRAEEEAQKRAAQEEAQRLVQEIEQTQRELREAREQGKVARFNELVRRHNNLVLNLEARKAELQAVHNREAGEVLDRNALTNFIAQGYNEGSDKRQLLDIEAAIKRGGVVFYQIINGQINTELPIDQYLAHLVDLMWYLNEQATMKDQAHDEGAYVLLFKNNPEYTERFYTFLLNYVKRVNPEWQQQSSHYVSANPYGYARLSSHLTKIRDQQKIQHFGIDVRRDFERWKESMKPINAANALAAAQQLDAQLEQEVPTDAQRPGSDGEGWLAWAYQGAASAAASAASAVSQAATQIQDSYSRGVFGTYPYAAHELPSGKEHILFFRYNDPVTDTEKLYIKLENHGIALGDLASHGQEYVAAQQRKTSSGEGDDRPSWRKERVPRKYSDAVAQIMQGTKITMPGTLKSFHALNQLRSLGIYPEFAPLLLEALSEYDYLAERTGREVIITQLEALGSYYYELQKDNNLPRAYIYRQIVLSLYDLHDKAQQLKREYYNRIDINRAVYFSTQQFGAEYNNRQNARLRNFPQDLFRSLEADYQKVEALQAEARQNRMLIPVPYSTFIENIMNSYRAIAQPTRTMAEVKKFFDRGAI